MGSYQCEAADFIVFHPADQGRFVTVPDVRFFPDLFGKHNLFPVIDRKHSFNLARHRFAINYAGCIREMGCHTGYTPS